MLGMDKTQVLSKFYQRNSINRTEAANPDSGSYDVRIAGLSAQVDAWLSGIDPPDQEIFMELLGQYDYLTEPVCQKRYVALLDMLEEQLGAKGIGLEQTLFVTVESSSPFQNGGDNVRSDLRKRNFMRIKKQQVVARQSRLSKDVVDESRAIVFLDDIVGTGVTLWGSMKEFYDKFLQDMEEKPPLFYACIAFRKEGIEHIQKNCNTFRIPAEFLSMEEWRASQLHDTTSPSYTKIGRYEKLVGCYNDPKHSFYMGFKKNRLLLSFHYNTPNNTLSMFWRATPTHHAPPFRRDGDQPDDVRPRPRVDDLKDKSNKLTGYAYAFGIDRKRAVERHE